MTKKQNRDELKKLRGEYEVARFNVMWNKIALLAAKDGDAGLVDDIIWYLKKQKYYVDRHATDNAKLNKARKAKAKIKDEDYDRLSLTAKSQKQLAGLFGVNPVSLSRYKARRFAGKS